MTVVYDPESGALIEIDQPPGPADGIVPLNLAAIDEDDLIQQFPTPVQAAGALLLARQLLAQAPAILHERSKAVRDAKRQLIVARGYARQRAEGRTLDDRKLAAESDPQVITAWEHLDTCELALEYARETRKSLGEDIEILRSLNANFRGEHR